MPKPGGKRFGVSPSPVVEVLPVRLLRPVLLAVLVPGLLVVPLLPAQAQEAAPPVVSMSAPAPVAPEVHELPLSGVDAAAAEEDLGAAPALRLGGSGRRTVLLTARQPTPEYGLVAVTWDHDAAVGTVEAWARTRNAGSWSPWTLIGGAADEEPDTGTPDVVGTTRDGTAPLFTAGAGGQLSDGVQVRLDAVSGPSPTGLRVSLIDPGTSTADTEAAAPSAATGAANLRTGTRPPIKSRAQWGADESIRGGSPSYASGIRAVTIHHTASSNDYGPADVPRIMRGFYAYHVKSRGWSDIGYNVLVDRFGTAWEGRAGGLDRAVIGAHAGGFNTGTAGISMIGTYEDIAPSPATLETVAQLAAWKLAGVSAQASVRITSGGSTRFSAGTAVTLPTVFGHRQVSTTSCPGTRGYAALPALRSRIAALQGGAAPTAGGLQLLAPPLVKAGDRATLQVRGGEPGSTVEVFFRRRGEATATKRRDATFDPNGSYSTDFPVDDDWTVFAVAGDQATRPSTVRRAPARGAVADPAAGPIAVQGPVTSTTGSSALVTATGPAGAELTVWFRRDGDQTFTRRRTGRFDTAGRYTTTYTADAPHEYFVRTATVATSTTTTLVGSVPDGLHVYAPDTVEAGESVPLVVQGTPGAPVAVWFAQPGQAPTRRREGVLAADGTYRTSYAGTAEHSFFATSGARSSTREATRVAGAPAAADEQVASLTLDTPGAVDAGSTVDVTVRGGLSQASAQLWTRRRGSSTFLRLREGSFDAAGSWATGFVATDDHELWATSGNGSSMSAATLVRPVVSGPAASALGARVALTGRARPGDTVVLESQRRGATTFTPTTTLTADAQGGFATSYAADDEYAYRAVADGRTGSLRRTTVAPTLSVPATAAPGSTVAVTGTARPGSSVQVLFRRDAPSFGVAGRRVRALPLFRLGRTLTADAAGRWQTSFVLAGAYRVLARADGNASPVRAAVPRSGR